MGTRPGPPWGHCVRRGLPFQRGPAPHRGAPSPALQCCPPRGLQLPAGARCLRVRPDDLRLHFPAGRAATLTHACALEPPSRLGFDLQPPAKMASPAVSGLSRQVRRGGPGSQREAPSWGARATPRKPRRGHGWGSVAAVQGRRARRVGAMPGGPASAPRGVAGRGAGLCGPDLGMLRARPRGAEAEGPGAGRPASPGGEPRTRPGPRSPPS